MLIFPILTDPCSFMVYYYLFDFFSFFRFLGFFQFTGKGNFWHSQILWVRSFKNTHSVTYNSQVTSITHCKHYLVWQPYSLSVLQCNNFKGEYECYYTLNSQSQRSSGCRLYNNHVKDTQGQGHSRSWLIMSCMATVHYF